MIFGFFAKKPEKEARELARDVGNIIGMAEQTYRPELLEEIARITRDGLAQIETLCADDSICQARQLDVYKSLHRDARRANAQAGLTAYTLIIINLRARPLGDIGDPVRGPIDEYLQRWPAKADPDTDSESEGTLAG